MTWIGITGNPEFTSNNSSNMLYVFGSLTLLSAMNYNYTGQVFFMASTPGKTVFSAGQTFNSSVFFDGVGEWTFLDEFTVGNGAGIFLYGGTIRTNNQTVTAGYFLHCLWRQSSIGDILGIIGAQYYQFKRLYIYMQLRDKPHF
ncbi:MAG: hypothetical protein IPN33_19395 [Saprospiraceae bacterium]|nr:hypothetical protein [Saprospiraceae bacterium]